MTSENDVLESIDKLYDLSWQKRVKPVKPLLSAHVNILVIRDIIKCVLSSPVILAQNQMMPI